MWEKVINFGCGYQTQKALKNNIVVGVGFDFNVFFGGQSTATDFTDKILLTKDHGNVYWRSNVALGPRYQFGWQEKNFLILVEYRHKLPLEMGTLNQNVFYEDTYASAVYQIGLSLAYKLY